MQDATDHQNAQPKAPQPEPPRRSAKYIFVERKEKVLSSLLGRNCLDSRIQPALVAAGGVLMQNALLHALVEHRDGLAVRLAQRLRIALGDRFTQRAQRASQLALVGAVHRGLGLGLTCALQRRNMICHKLSSLNPYVGRGKWGAGYRPADTQPAALPASSKSTELPPNGQPSHGLNPRRFPTLDLLLDAIPATIYSLPIFGTRLATLAIPVAVPRRTPRARRPQQPLSPLPSLTLQPLNPASPDGGQHTT